MTEITPDLIKRVKALRVEGMLIGDIADHQDIKWTGSLEWLGRIAGPLPRRKRAGLDPGRPVARVANGNLTYNIW